MTEKTSTPSSPRRGMTSAAVSQDKYHEMLALADHFDRVGAEIRDKARLGSVILSDDDVADSAELSPSTYSQAEDDIRSAMTGKNGLLTRSVELDADALVVRATVLTYQWIDELQQAAYKTLGSIAGRAVGYLAPEVELGGAIVSAGLIETDTLDRDGVAGYLNDLAATNPELMEHLSSGGGLLEGLQLRSMLTSDAMAGDDAEAAARGGLRAMGVQAFPADSASALRDAAASLHAEEAVEAPIETAAEDTGSSLPTNLTDLMANLIQTDRQISVQRVGTGRFIAYLPGHRPAPTSGLRLVGGTDDTYVRDVVAAIELAVGDEPEAHVMLVGAAQGGVAATEVAAAASSRSFVVDQVITAGAPSAHVPTIPQTTRVLSLEDRSDPVAMLGQLINATAANRVTVVFDAAGDETAYLDGARAADGATHPGLRAELANLHQLGYLAS